MANETVFRRFEGNPIIVPGQVPRANSIFNSAAIPYGDGYVGVFRVDEIDRRATLHVGWSKDGLKWDIEPERLKMECSDPEIATHAYGYDPRVTPVEGVNYLTWCNSYHGPTIGVARTDDFRTFTQMENCFPPYNRNGVLFPRKVGGKFAMLHRPSDRGHTPFGDIFYCESPDLVHWGRQRHVFGPRGGWQSTKVGAGPSPIETDEGWLLIYHGVLTSCNGFVYSVGAALLDLDEPWKVLHRTRDYLMAPTTDYERVGDVPNVCFPCAAIIDGSRRMTLYYGCADTCVGVAYADLDEIITFTKERSFR